MCIRRFLTRLVSVLIAAACAGCIRTSARKIDSANSSTPSVPAQVGNAAEQPLAALPELNPPHERTAFGQKLSGSSLHDILFALAVCDCLPRLQKYLIHGAHRQRGALPQALTPAIRREILSNPKLKILEIVPRPIDDIVGGIFADEKSVSDEIAKALRDKIKFAEPAWAEAEATSVLHLDGFVPLPATIGVPDGRAVRMLDVWSRWAVIFSQGGPWSSRRDGDPDAGLLWLELLRALAEGEYLFGLAESESGGSWGGLTIPVDLQINNTGSFDPRKSYNQVRFLAGQLRLTLPSNNSLTLARFGGEKWTWRDDAVPLAEQAVQWWTFSRLLNRLRPSQRSSFAGFFPNLIPEDSHQLALLVLPAIDALLSERFIDAGSRAIAAYISGPVVGGASTSVREHADAQTLSILLLALSNWISELKRLDDLSLSAETSAQLKAAPQALQRGAQLIVQNLLGEVISPRGFSAAIQDNPSDSVFVDLVKTERRELPIRTHAQVLHALTISEHSFMQSPYLRGRIVRLANGLLQRHREKTSSGSPPETLTDAIWINLAAAEFAKNYPDSPLSSSLRALADETDRGLQNFEESVLQ